MADLADAASNMKAPAPLSKGTSLLLGLAAAASTLTAPPAFAEARLPPIDRGAHGCRQKDAARCMIGNDSQVLDLQP